MIIAFIVSWFTVGLCTAIFVWLRWGVLDIVTFFRTTLFGYISIPAIILVIKSKPKP